MTPPSGGDAIPPNFLNIDEPPTAPHKGSSDYDKPPPVIPRAPKRKALALTGVDKGGIPEKAAAAANMKLRGASYQDIAEVCEYANAAEAQAAVLKVLAATHSPDEWETMRVIAAARAELLLEQSLAMASADYLIDDTTGERIPNDDRRLWHGAAQTDLMNWVGITGAKAPAKVEVTPGDVTLERIVNQILERSGHREVHEADVLELDQIPPGPSATDDDLDLYG